MSYKDISSEVIVLLSWDEKLRLAYVKAMKEYIKCGSPGIPLGEYNYRLKYKKLKKR